MKISQVMELLDAKVICGEDSLGKHVYSACGSDMMSDVLAYVKDQSVLLTGLGWFDKIGKFAGAGTLVPITGFANSVVSPAIDSRAEGLILGVGAKIFAVSGPVLLYATLSGSVYGVIYYFVGLFSGS